MTVYIPATVSVDGTALSSLGLVVETLTNVRATVPREDSTVTVAGLAGATLTETLPQVGVRDFTIAGTILGGSASACLSAYNSLCALCAGGSKVLVLQDDTTRRITARLRGQSFTCVEVALGAASAKVELQWRAIDPYWEDVTATTVSLTTSPAACAMGSAETWPTIVINQSCTITYKTSAGTTVYTLVVTGVSGAQTASIDMRARTITHSVSGITPSLRTSGRYFRLSPREGVYASSSWPTLTLSTGTGTATYRKAWEG